MPAGPATWSPASGSIRRCTPSRVTLALLVLVWVPASLSAQGLGAVLGRSADRDRAIVALLAMHPFEAQFPEVEWTGGVGLQVGQWFGATFVNSYDERSFIAGIARHWYDARRGVVDFGIGYRLGLVSGYDERLFDLAAHTPVLPFVGFLAYVDVGPMGVDAFYVYRAIALEGSVHF